MTLQTLPREDAAVKTYCLGVGCMTKCETCQHEKNWQLPGQMPTAMFQAMKRSAVRVNESACQITSGCYYRQEAA